MAIERSDSQQTTCSAVLTIDGQRMQAASATSVIRPGKNFTLIFQVDVDRSKLSADDIREITAMFAAYAAEEIKKAAASDIPVALPD